MPPHGRRDGRLPRGADDDARPSPSLSDLRVRAALPPRIGSRICVTFASFGSRGDGVCTWCRTDSDPQDQTLQIVLDGVAIRPVRRVSPSSSPPSRG